MCRLLDLQAGAKGMDPFHRHIMSRLSARVFLTCTKSQVDPDERRLGGTGAARPDPTITR